MDPTMILAWLQVVAEVGAILERLMIVGRRIQSGEPITREELDAAKQATAETMARWEAAKESDQT